jgi:hypothetical protein
MARIRTFRYDVQRKMLKLIGQEGSNSCFTIFRRFIEIVKVAGSSASPILNLAACGLVFDQSRLYIQPALLSTAIFLPPSLIDRRLSQAAFPRIPDPVFTPDFCRIVPDKAKWEARCYPDARECQRLLALVSSIRGFAFHYTTVPPPPEQAFGVPDVRPGVFTPIGLPRTRAEGGFQTLCFQSQGLFSGPVQISLRKEPLPPPVTVGEPTCEWAPMCDL